MPFPSKELERLVDFKRGLDEEIDLAKLCGDLVAGFGEKADIAKALLQSADGKIKQGMLGLHLLGVLKSDSAVRDVLTTGHLAKFLSRLDVFRKTSNYGIIGLPNRLFDKRSHVERAKYFELGFSLALEADAVESSDAQAMMQREFEILGNSICEWPTKM